MLAPLAAREVSAVDDPLLSWPRMSPARPSPTERLPLVELWWVELGGAADAFSIIGLIFGVEPSVSRLNSRPQHLLTTLCFEKKNL